jgi:erythrin-vacuolar iron transport family protein
MTRPDAYGSPDGRSRGRFARHGRLAHRYQGDVSERDFLLRRAQPLMVGLIDGSLSTLAPIFAVALATRNTHYALLAGLATAIGAAISMAYSEALSDTGDVTERGSPLARGVITGVGTFVGGALHALPFVVPHFRTAVVAALVLVAFELVALAWLRTRFFSSSFRASLFHVTVGGAVITGVSLTLGVAG